MKMMLQLEDDPESFQEWASRLEPTGEGRDDDDEEEVFNAAKEAIDRIAEVVSMEVFMPILGQLIKQYSEQEDWKARHAALCAVQQCVEYVEDKSHIDAMVELCMKCAADVHPRVRHYALHGIGQIANDQAPYFQDTFYQSIMPLLLKCLDEQFDRVCAMAMSAFVSFGEELEPALMLEYSKPFMQKLVEKLHVSNHSGVQGESITSIAVIAGIIEKDFSEYYDDIMPMLKTLVNNPDTKDSKIRCKSFECISLLGSAVGKEKFKDDAQEAVAAMKSTPLNLRDGEYQHSEYIKETYVRICRCFERDFVVFLPDLLPQIFEILKLEDESSSVMPEDAPDDSDSDSDDGFVEVKNDAGKFIKVRSAKFQEMEMFTELLQTIVENVGGAFYPYIQKTAEVILLLLEPPTDYMDLARAFATEVWALLIKSATEGSKEQNCPNTLGVQLLQKGLEKMFKI